jgi:trehalose-6-phosphate synthase
MVKIFPWSDVVLQGILGCDLVGFHIEDYCINFIDCCHRGLGCRVDRPGLLVEHGGRTVRVRPLPISIPFSRFEQLALAAQDSAWEDVQVQPSHFSIYPIVLWYNRKVSSDKLSL